MDGVVDGIGRGDVVVVVVVGGTVVVAGTTCARGGTVVTTAAATGPFDGSRSGDERGGTVVEGTGTVAGAAAPWSGGWSTRSIAVAARAAARHRSRTATRHRRRRSSSVTSPNSNWS